MENRTQEVAVTGVTSSVSTVTSGVPQDTVRVGLLAMCRGELSAVIARLMSKCMSSRWKW